MKILICPINGARPISEFVYGGELKQMPHPQTATDQDWADYVFARNGAPAIKQEWWCHAPSQTWFIAERNTLTDEFLRTYLYKDLEIDSNTNSPIDLHTDLNREDKA